jgi:ABC-type polysaccharide/polyol phosphate transport system ATPase subunit
MAPTVLEVDGLSKLYRRGLPSGSDRITELLSNAVHGCVKAPLRWLGRRAAPVELRPGGANEFWALKDVAFEIRAGEGVAIVGANGAGKSTLLKIISRVTQPTHGRFRIRGRVASLLEAGVGFHGELTGRENIFLGGALLGVERRVIARKFADVVDYSGIADFLDTPVKRYSSGMYTRLAFAVAIFMDLDILIVDEILSVGDAAFQKRALATLREQLNAGKTVLYVSHDARQLHTLCDRFVMLEKGRVVAQGPIDSLETARPGTPTSDIPPVSQHRVATSPDSGHGPASPAIQFLMGLPEFAGWDLRGSESLRLELRDEAERLTACFECPWHSLAGLNADASGDRAALVSVQGLAPGAYTATLSLHFVDGRQRTVAHRPRLEVATIPALKGQDSEFAVGIRLAITPAGSNLPT